MQTKKNRIINYSIANRKQGESQPTRKIKYYVKKTTHLDSHRHTFTLSQTRRRAWTLTRTP